MIQKPTILAEENKEAPFNFFISSTKLSEVKPMEYSLEARERCLCCQTLLKHNELSHPICCESCQTEAIRKIEAMEFVHPETKQVTVLSSVKIKNPPEEETKELREALEKAYKMRSNKPEAFHEAVYEELFPTITNIVGKMDARKAKWTSDEALFREDCAALCCAIAVYKFRFNPLPWWLEELLKKAMEMIIANQLSMNAVIVSFGVVGVFFIAEQMVKWGKGEVGGLVLAAGGGSALYGFATGALMFSPLAIPAAFAATCAGTYMLAKSWFSPATSSIITGVRAAPGGRIAFNFNRN